MKSAHPEPQLPVSHPEPVAYDKDGRPLYAHPPQQQPPQFTPDTSDSHYATPHQPVQPIAGAGEAPPKPQVVYLARPHEPVKPHISEAVQKKHEDSKRYYPHLNLSDGEYVISAIRRHPIGLLGIWSVTAVGVVAVLGSIPFVTEAATTTFSAVSDGPNTMLVLMLCMTAILIFLGGVIATIVYNANRFFLTNESVMQHIQTSLFSKKEQTISLANIEDASFRQQGIIQHLLGYGSLRLSTEGDETTYRFNYVAHPQKQVTLLNDAVEAFKNGRPFGGDD